MLRSLKNRVLAETRERHSSLSCSRQEAYARADGEDCRQKSVFMKSGLCELVQFIRAGLLRQKVIDRQTCFWPAFNTGGGVPGAIAAITLPDSRHVCPFHPIR